MRPIEKFEISEMEKFIEQHELRHVRSNFIERIITLVIGSMSLIAALAWDEALKHIFEQLFGSQGTLFEQISYAVIITVIAALLSVKLGKMIAKREEKD